ncbi:MULTISPECIES: hypothetical protein [Microbacterium]|uniref:Uncharacterized protein n=1 Tax=Microbacterium maritypicum TaxID=33918 RepID=A0ACD4B287_MICMQ|nr:MULTISPECIES: hypothetical protein [Microbacterium]UTT51614.1 hypothetical protein NMQ05_10960 [Microbacterium liquefaciens]
MSTSNTGATPEPKSAPQISAATQVSRPAVAILGVGQLALLTLVVVASLRSLPAMATYGLGSIMLYLIPAIVFSGADRARGGGARDRMEGRHLRMGA